MFDCNSIIHRLRAKEVCERERGISCNQSSEQQWINDIKSEGGLVGRAQRLEKRAGHTPPLLLADES